MHLQGVSQELNVYPVFCGLGKKLLAVSSRGPTMNGPEGRNFGFWRVLKARIWLLQGVIDVRRGTENTPDSSQSSEKLLKSNVNAHVTYLDDQKNFIISQKTSFLLNSNHRKHFIIIKKQSSLKTSFKAKEFVHHYY